MHLSGQEACYYIIEGHFYHLNDCYVRNRNVFNSFVIQVVRGFRPLQVKFRTIGVASWCLENQPQIKPIECTNFEFFERKLETGMAQSLRRGFWNSYLELMIFHCKWNKIYVAQLIEYLAGVLKDPNLIPGAEEFLSLKFHLKRKWDEWKRARTRKTTTTRVIPKSLTNARRQKDLRKAIQLETKPRQQS